MKNLRILICLALLIGAGIGIANADLLNTLKKVGKGIDKIGKTVKEQSEKNDNSPKQSESQGGLEFKIIDAARWGDKMLVIYSITNNFDDDIEELELALSSSLQNNESSVAYDNNKTSYFELTEYLRNNTDVPAGSTRRGAILASEFPAKAKTADIFLRGSCVYQKEPRSIKREFKDVPIRGFKPSNVEGSYITHPDMVLDIKGVKRNGNKVDITYTITNPEEDDIKFYVMANRGNAYDSEGKGYKLTGDSGSFTVRAGKSVAYTVTLDDVPNRVKKLQSVEIPVVAENYDLPHEFKVIIGDVDIK